MAFVLLLLLSLSVILRVESAAAATAKQQSQAHSNALLGLSIALGELQEQTGSDLIATATATILDNPNNPPTSPIISTQLRWTGVWRSDGTTVNPHWLVSGNASLDPVANAGTYLTPFSALTDPVQLVSARGTAPNIIDAVEVETVPIENTNGAYGYWISDESTKASVALSNPYLNTPADTRNHMQANRSGLETLADLQSFAGTNDFQEKAARIAWPNEFGVYSNTAAAVAPEYFHDLTTEALGLLTNPKNGGLKTDLSSALRWTDLGTKEPSGFNTAGDQIFGPQLDPTPTIEDPGGPTWKQLASFYNMADDPAFSLTGSTENGDLTINVRPQTDDEIGVFPVISRLLVGWSVSDVNNGGDVNGRMEMVPIIVLWNPFNVELNTQDYLFELSLSAGCVYFAAGSQSKFMDQQTNLRDKGGRARDFLSGNSPGNAFGFVRRSLIFRLQSPSIAPGEFVVFSLNQMESFQGFNLRDSNNEYMSGPYVMTPGYRPEFAVHQLFSQNTSDNAIYTGGTYAGQKQNNFPIPAAENVRDETDFGFTMAERSMTWSLRLARAGSDSTDVTELDTSPLAHIVELERHNIGGAGEWLNEGNTRNDGRTPKPTNFANTPSANPSFLTTPSGSFPRIGATLSLQWNENHDDFLVTGIGRFQEQIPLQWARYCTPIAPVIDNSPIDTGHETGFKGPPNYLQRLGYNPATMNFEIEPAPDQPAGLTFPDFARAMGGGSDESNANGGVSHYPIVDITEDVTEFTSIASLSNVQLSKRNNASVVYDGSVVGVNTASEVFHSPDNLKPVQSIGAGHASGFLSPSVTSERYTHNNSTGIIYDHTYLMNEALWDSYFFSSLPVPIGLATLPDDIVEGTSVLANPRMRVSNADENTLLDPEQCATQIEVAGVFNINSTSVDAWKAVLAGTLGAEINTENGVWTDTAAPFSRLKRPRDVGTTSSTNTQDPISYLGFRAIDDTGIGSSSGELTALAELIVEEIMDRGPFLSLSDFINRDPDAVNTDADVQFRQKAGSVLETALARSSINAGFNDDLILQKAITGTVHKPDSWSNYTDRDIFEIWSGANAAGVNGYLTQVDLLKRIGSFITTRGDTFRIRAYGRSVDNLTGLPNGEAWCEAIVKRQPDFIDPTNPAHTPYDNAAAAAAGLAQLTQLNKDIGRRYEIIAFRWLSADEI